MLPGIKSRNSGKLIFEGTGNMHIYHRCMYPIYMCGTCWSKTLLFIDIYLTTFQNIYSVVVLLYKKTVTCRCSDFHNKNAQIRLLKILYNQIRESL